MAKIITISNNKGGNGKTTTAVNFGAALRLRGYNVLLIDYDGQSNLTQTLGITPERGCTVYDMIQEGAAIIPPVRVMEPVAGMYGVLDVLPACEDMAAVEVEQAAAPDRITRLSSVILPYRDKYDYILIDTPPALGLVTISTLYTADEIIITVEPHYLAVGGLVRLSNTIQQVNANRGTQIRPRVLFVKYDRRKGLHRLTVEQVEGAGFATFNTKIRENISLAEAPAAGVDIFRYDGKSKGAEDYAAMCAEYLDGIQPSNQ